MGHDRIGIIGVGNIGAPMAMRMLERGARITVYDRNPEATNPLRALGASVVQSSRELADVVDIVIASLPTREASLEVALGTEGAIHGSAIKVYIETSTVGSAVITEIDRAFRAAGKEFLDAPVSGGPPGARAGTLAVLASGSKTALAIVRDTLDLFAANVFYLGEQAGASQVAKLINNHVSAAGRLAVLEGLSMAVKAGIDVKTMNDVFNASSGRNFTTTHKVPAAILTGAYKYNGPLTIALKDQALLLEEARQRGIPLWIAPRILETFEEAAAAGYRHEDGMRIFEYMSEQTREPVVAPQSQRK